MHPQLEAFVETVRRGSVTEAAHALFVTQPALTARLNALEQDVGVALLVRRRGGVRLTEAGRAFLPYAERALQAVADGRDVLTELGRGIAGHVAVCASPIVSTYALPTILKRFSETHPGVQVAVRTGHSEEMIELVKRGRGGGRAAPRVRRSRRRAVHALRGRARTHRPRGAPLRRGRSARRATGRALRPLRPRVELPRPDERHVPRGRYRSAQRHGARQRRLGEEDGRARTRCRVPPRRRGVGRGPKR